MKGESRQLNPDSRKEVSGSYAFLSDGVTHYDLAGPNKGPTLVLIHGAGLNSLSTWDPLAKHLIQNGFRILRYDLFGQGYSDRPEKKYGPDLFVRQLEELLSELKLTEAVWLVGFSMGGAIAAWYARLHRESTRGVVLLAPGGINVDLGLGIRMLRLPLAGELILRFLGRLMLINRYRAMEHAPEYARHALEQVTLEFPGTRRALLSVLRNMPLNETVEIYRQIGQWGIPVLAVFGKQDRAVPISVSPQLKHLIPQAEIHEIADASHGLVYDNASEISRITLEFLAQHV